jgi:hypothetical protein
MSGKFAFLCIAVAVLFWLVPKADAHLVVRSKAGQPAWKIEQNQFKNIRHAQWVLRQTRSTKNYKWIREIRSWHSKSIVWLRASHDRMMHRFIRPWLPTYHCEHGTGGWYSNTGNDYYGGLQFDYGTWKNHGGFQFASHAHKATPIQQVTVASRLTYDGWPNCPNP